MTSNGTFMKVEMLLFGAAAAVGPSDLKGRSVFSQYYQLYCVLQFA